MENADNFAIMLPIIQASFGLVFLLMHRAGVGTARFWGIGYLLNGLAISIFLVDVDVHIQTLLSDTLYFASFYFFSGALLHRFGAPAHRRLRFGFVVAAMLVDAYVVYGLESLHVNLVFMDSALAVLIGMPILLVMGRARHAIDRVIVGLSALTALHSVGLALSYAANGATSESLDDFLVSSYAYYMQIGSALLGLWFGLAALAAISLDTLNRYRAAAERDPLTGLLNRRGFDVALLALSADAPAEGVVMTIDIDHFKQVNDTFGHASGDLVLAGLADLLVSRLPPEALAARFGGEEFVVFLPAMQLGSGSALAQSLRMACAARDWRPAGVDRQITLCVGVSATLEGEDNLKATIARADTALYAAKQAGRNRVMLQVGDAAATAMPAGQAAA